METALILSQGMKWEYLVQATNSICLDINKNRKGNVYRREGIVRDLIYVGSYSDGEVYDNRTVLHIREKTAEGSFFFGLFKWADERSLVMLEHEEKDSWKVHVVNELSDLIDSSIRPSLDDFSRKTNEKYSIILEKNIEYSD